MRRIPSTSTAGLQPSRSCEARVLFSVAACWWLPLSRSDDRL